MILIAKEARCDKCNKLLDLVEGMEWVPYHGLYCQPCADAWKELIKRLGQIEKERKAV
jgi:phage FluMu protein Com